MSRLKRYSHALATGYLLVGVNVLYTLASVPLALHYLSREEFGLWALIMQVSGYLVLVDLGMAGSISRILIDHKDRPADGVYGSIIKTGSLVLMIQGAVIAVGGSIVSWWLPNLFAVPAVYRHDFQVLMAGQCAVLGLLFLARMPGHVLYAHQRYDAFNSALIGSLVVNLGAMWLGFHLGRGLYSLLFAYVASELFKAVFTMAAVLRLKILPPPGAWGHANRTAFHELFSYGREIFLVSIGWQLINASQVMLVSRTLGLEAAAVWSIATKAFALGQQLIYRILDFSSGALSEMMVRQERGRLLARLRDLTILSASFSVWLGLSVALCNQSFLALWTKGRISWSPSSDWLMAALVILYSTTRCFMGFIGLTKQIRRMKYVYLAEGVGFIALSVFAAPRWGLNGIIAGAVITDLLCSGTYGLWRVKDYFGEAQFGTLWAWMRSPLYCLLCLAAVSAAAERVTAGLNPRLQFGLEFPAALLVGGAIFWQIGLTRGLRSEALSLLSRLRSRL